MKLRLGKSHKEVELKLGDIIVDESDGEAFLVIVANKYSSRSYVARNLNGSGGFIGSFCSLRDLSNEFNRLVRNKTIRATVYSADEYALRLVKK